MLLILFNYALCPPMWATLWLKHKRELSLLKFVQHFQALAARCMQAIFQSELELHRFLQRACAAAERLAAKASRKRWTTAQILQEDFRQPLECVAFAAAVRAQLHAYAPAGDQPQSQQYLCPTRPGRRRLGCPVSRQSQLLLATPARNAPEAHRLTSARFLVISRFARKVFTQSGAELGLSLPQGLWQSHAQVCQTPAKGAADGGLLCVDGASVVTSSHVP